MAQEDAEEGIENFCMDRKNQNYVFLEGECFLKTKTNSLKRHWAVLMGNEIYCYRNKLDVAHRVMHSLVGTFIKEMPEEIMDEVCVYPVKIVLPPNKSRILYFKSQQEQVKWAQNLKEAMGYANLFDFYTLESTLGQG